MLFNILFADKTPSVEDLEVLRVFGGETMRKQVFFRLAKENTWKWEALYPIKEKTQEKEQLCTPATDLGQKRLGAASLAASNSSDWYWKTTNFKLSNHKVLE